VELEHGCARNAGNSGGGNNKNSRKFQVLFDCGQDTITLAKGMSQPAAHLLAEKLMK
jgi:hypothetical protein